MSKTNSAAAVALATAGRRQIKTSKDATEETIAALVAAGFVGAWSEDFGGGFDLVRIPRAVTADDAEGAAQLARFMAAC